MFAVYKFQVVSKDWVGHRFQWKRLHFYSFTLLHFYTLIWTHFHSNILWGGNVENGIYPQCSVVHKNLKTLHLCRRNAKIVLFVTNVAKISTTSLWGQFLYALASLKPILFSQSVFWIADNLRIHQWKWDCANIISISASAVRTFSHVKCHGISMSNVMACQMSWQINVKCQMSNVKCHGISMSNFMAYQRQMYL